MISDYDNEKKRLLRDRSARRKLSERLIPGLPVDADAIETRVKTPRVGLVLDDIVRQLTEVREPFFDIVCDKWQELFPQFPGRPGRYRDGRLFIYVNSSGLVFSLRSKLSKMKKALMTLPCAPKKFTMHLEVH